MFVYFSYRFIDVSYVYLFVCVYVSCLVDFFCRFYLIFLLDPIFSMFVHVFYV